jgi:hypothetical protein
MYIIILIIIIILIHKIIIIYDEIEAKNNIIEYLKKDAIQNIKNNLELSDQKYIINDLNNKLKKEIEIKKKLKKFFKIKKITKTNSEIFEIKIKKKLKRSYSCNDL